MRAGGEADWPIVDDAVRAAFEELVTSGGWGRYLGPHCDRLRAALVEAHRVDGDAPEVRLCSSGTAAVLLALVGVGVRAGDEVILSAYDFKANVGNIRSLDAVPVLVDAQAGDAQMDIDRVAEAITPQTRAVIASHLHGGSVDMPALRDAVAGQPVAIVEDICQNPLAGVDGRPAGTWGQAAAISFGGSKTLSAGRGGAVVCRTPEVAARIRRYAERGNDLSPLSEMQAAVLMPQLEALPARAARRREAAAWLGERLAPLGLSPLECRIDRCEPDYYKVGFRYDAARFGGWSRERFCEAMHAEHVTLSPGFPALHTTHAARTLRLAGPLDEAERLGRSLVTLHHPVLLEGPDRWAEVVAAVGRLRDYLEDQPNDKTQPATEHPTEAV